MRKYVFDTNKASGFDIGRIQSLDAQQGLGVLNGSTVALPENFQASD